MSTYDKVMGKSKWEEGGCLTLENPSPLGVISVIGYNLQIQSSLQKCQGSS